MLGILIHLFPIFLYGIIALFGLLLYLRFSISKRFKAQNAANPKKIRLAFFHPKCNAGGGGEKVLWCMVDSLMKSYSADRLEIAIYTGGDAPDEEILKKAEDRFQVKLPRSPLFVRVERHRLIDPDLYPVFTMVGQIMGTMVLTVNSLNHYVPHYFVDTIGLAFSYWLVKFLAPECKVGAYVHYPFISKEMLENITEKKKRYNNSGRIADSPILSSIKVYYYKALIYLYGLMGKQVDFAWANSTWTTDHIKSVWPSWGQNADKSHEIKTLYPPCNVKKFSSLSMDKKQNSVLSFAQYRPEKNHRLQLEIFKEVLSRNPEKGFRFNVVGSCRGPEDEEFLKGIKQYAVQLGVQDKVEFHVNLPLDKMLEVFERSSYAIHTMEAEHFGIAVVEMMAAGLAVIAHNSAGPKLDIIRERKSNPVGFLASSRVEYIEHLDHCVKNADKPFFKDMVNNARKDIAKFSDENFKEIFARDMKKVLGE